MSCTTRKRKTERKRGTYRLYRRLFREYDEHWTNAKQRARDLQYLMKAPPIFVRSPSNPYFTINGVQAVS